MTASQMNEVIQHLGRTVLQLLNERLENLERPAPE
jgi:hypothetical protein